jgi:hypothetical protein
MLKELRQALKQAIPDTEATLTEKLRQSASQSGWHPDVVANLHVKHSDEGFKVQVSPEFSERAFIHEHGDESSRPTAVIHKFGNNSKEIQKIYLKHFNEHYGRLR